MFILNRTRDWATMPRKKILLQAVIWFIAMFILSALLIVVCTAVYRINGIDPRQLTKFGGDISSHLDKPVWLTVVLLLIIAPVVEEIIFRLGLSFKRQTAAVWVGLLPIAIAGYLFQCYDNWLLMAAMAVVGAGLFWLVMHYTTDEQWATWKSRYLRLAMWISAIAFALIHLKAFSVITWALLPYCLTVILRPGLVGCVITYARVNLGFWWGVLFHVANNVPAILALLAISGQ